MLFDSFCLLQRDSARRVLVEWHYLALRELWARENQARQHFPVFRSIRTAQEARAMFDELFEELDETA